MKRIIQNYDKRSRSKKIFCCSFFFNARGTRLENSPLGLYRTLLFQLLYSSDSLLEDFLPKFLRKEEECLGGEVTWQTPEISEYFHSAITNLRSRPVYLFIDALDECEEEEVRSIVQRFEKTSANTVSNGTVLKICLASRHYPYISLRIIGGQEIFMEAHNGSDIRHYVNQEFNLHEYPRTDLIKSLVNKSAGIFIWTLFVVRRLLKASDQGYSAQQIEILLDSVSPDLEGLFEDTLRGMETGRRAAITILAPWVVCASRPLTLYELYIAVAFSTEEPPLSLLDVKFSNTSDLERFRKHLIDVSGGLFETVSINGELFVQVIHETVREFFLASEKAAKFIELPVGKGFLQHSHEWIVRASCRYLHVKELREPLPPPQETGYTTINDLAAMLHKPIKIPFDLFTGYGVS